MRKMLALMVLVFLFAGSVFASDKEFEALDKNRDGKVDVQEYQDAVDETFRRIDRNGDGFIDRSEMRAVQGADADKLFERMDRNRDGRIHLEEFRAEALKQFQALDANEDHCLDSLEWTQRQTHPEARPLLKIYF